jgi:hypothetical protein
MDQNKQVKEQTTEILMQLNSLLLLMNEDQYTSNLEILSSNSIGKHVRHIIEYYLCLIKGIKEGIVNYDQRQRSLEIENNLNYAIQVVQNIIFEIESLEDESICMQVEYADNLMSIQTSIFREIAYNTDHAVHHMAMIKIGIKSNFNNLLTAENFGVAYSTQQHYKSIKSE